MGDWKTISGVPERFDPTSASEKPGAALLFCQCFAWDNFEVLGENPTDPTTPSIGLPSGNLTELWKITIFNGKIHYKWPCSIAFH